MTNPDLVKSAADPILADDVLLRPAAAAPLLGRSVQTLATDRMKGVGCPWVRVGRFALYRVGTVRQYVASCARRSTSSAVTQHHLGA